MSPRVRDVLAMTRLIEAKANAVGDELVWRALEHYGDMSPVNAVWFLEGVLMGKAFADATLQAKLTARNRKRNRKRAKGRVKVEHVIETKRRLER